MFSSPHISFSRMLMFVGARGQRGSRTTRSCVVVFKFEKKREHFRLLVEECGRKQDVVRNVVKWLEELGPLGKTTPWAGTLQGTKRKFDECVDDDVQEPDMERARKRIFLERAEHVEGNWQASEPPTKKPIRLPTRPKMSTDANLLERGAKIYGVDEGGAEIMEVEERMPSSHRCVTGLPAVEVRE